jgi:hypothetical protein
MLAHARGAAAVCGCASSKLLRLAYGDSLTAGIRCAWHATLLLLLLLYCLLQLATPLHLSTSSLPACWGQLLHITGLWSSWVAATTLCWVSGSALDRL